MADNTPINMNGDGSQFNINTGTGSMYINNFGGSQTRSIYQASSDLRYWYKFIFGEKHIDRDETNQIIEWIYQTRETENSLDKVTLVERVGVQVLDPPCI